MKPIECVRNSSAKVVIVVADKTTHDPIDLSAGTTTVELKLKRVGATSLAGTVVCTKLTGLQSADGSVDTTAPYDTPGRGGRVQADVPASVFSSAGDHVGELKVTDGLTGAVVIPHQLVEITVREEL